MDILSKYVLQGQNNPCIKIPFSLWSQQLFKSVCRAAAELLQCVLSEGETCCPSQQQGAHYRADYNDTEQHRFLDQGHLTTICLLSMDRQTLACLCAGCISARLFYMSILHMGCYSHCPMFPYTTALSASLSPFYDISHTHTHTNIFVRVNASLKNYIIHNPIIHSLKII